MIRSGKTINFHEFHEIRAKEVKNRIGTNPQNSELMTIKDGRRIYIKPSSKLKSAAKSQSV